MNMIKDTEAAKESPGSKISRLKVFIASQVIVRTVNCGQSWDICSSNSRSIFIGIVNYYFFFKTTL
nr:hypothetical protein Iba_chr05bCG2460 [Ipomoea batatas]